MRYINQLFLLSYLLNCRAVLAGRGSLCVVSGGDARLMWLLVDLL